MKIRQKLFLTAVTFCMAVNFLWAQSSNTTDLFAQTSEMNNLMVNYDADLGAINRFYSTTAASPWGRQSSTYNSPERRARLLKLNTDYLDKLNKVDFDKMSINGKVDFILFKRNLDDSKYQWLEEQKTYDQVSKYFPFSDRIYALEKPRRRGAAVNGEQIAKELNSIQKEIEKAITGIKKEDAINIKLANFASDAAKGLQGSLKNLFDFYNGYDPLFTWWVPKTYNNVDSLLNVYADLLKSKGKETSTQKDDGSGIVGNPIGSKELIRQLQMEFIPYTAEELVEIANKEFAYCDAELLKASREMGFGDN